jgi:hypothetical protein
MFEYKNIYHLDLYHVSHIFKQPISTSSHDIREHYIRLKYVEPKFRPGLGVLPQHPVSVDVTAAVEETSNARFRVFF